MRSATGKSKNTVRATIMIESGDCCVRLSRSVFNNGVAVNLISRHAVEKAGLTPYKVEPATVELPNGDQVVYDEAVNITVWIAGVTNRIRAYVNVIHATEHMILGATGMRAFLCVMTLGHGYERGWKVTVAQNSRGLRTLRRVVKQEPDASTLTVMDKRQGVKWSRENGKTAKELEVEKSRARYQEREEEFYGPLY